MHISKYRKFVQKRKPTCQQHQPPKASELEAREDYHIQGFYDPKSNSPNWRMQMGDEKTTKIVPVEIE